MSRDALKTLFHPFETGIIDPPGEGERVLFLGAEAGYRLPEGFVAPISAVQPLRPLYRALEAMRADVSLSLRARTMTSLWCSAANTRARTRTASPRR